LQIEPFTVLETIRQNGINCGSGIGNRHRTQATWTGTGKVVSILPISLFALQNTKTIAVTFGAEIWFPDCIEPVPI
jgi:hypothetical protein